MRKKILSEKYMVNFEDAKRDIEAKLDKIDRNKGTLAHKAETQRSRGDVAGADKTMRQHERFVRFGSKALKKGVYEVTLVGKFRYTTRVNANSAEEAGDRAMREAQVAAKGVTLYDKKVQKATETT